MPPPSRRAMAAESDWWTVREMKLFNQRDQAALDEAGGTPLDPTSRADWGTGWTGPGLPSTALSG